MEIGCWSDTLIESQVARHLLFAQGLEESCGRPKVHQSPFEKLGDAVPSSLRNRSVECAVDRDALLDRWTRYDL